MSDDGTQNETKEPQRGVLLSRVILTLGASFAIILLIASVAGTFFIGLGCGCSEQHTRTGVSAQVNESTETVTVLIVTMGNSDYVVLRGPLRTKLGSEGRPHGIGSEPDGELDNTKLWSGR